MSSKKIQKQSFYGKEKPWENVSVLEKAHNCNAWCSVKKGINWGLSVAGPILTTAGEVVSLFAPEIGEPMAMLGLAAEGIEAMIPENDPFNPQPTTTVPMPMTSSYMDVEPNHMNTLRKHSSYNRPNYTTPIQKKVKTSGESMINPITPGDLQRDALKREMLYKNLRGESAPKVARIPNIANSMDTDPKKMTNDEWLNWVKAGAPDAEKYQTPSASSRMLTSTPYQTKGAPMSKLTSTTAKANASTVSRVKNAMAAKTTADIKTAFTDPFAAYKAAQKTSLNNAYSSYLK